MTLISTLIVLTILFIARSEIKNRRWMNAFDLHNDMFNKYIELCEDDFMTDFEWKEWLPIFEEADKIFARDCPDVKLDPLSSKIRSIISDEELTQD